MNRPVGGDGANRQTGEDVDGENEAVEANGLVEARVADNEADAHEERHAAHGPGDRTEDARPGAQRALDQLDVAIAGLLAQIVEVGVRVEVEVAAVVEYGRRVADVDVGAALVGDDVRAGVVAKVPVAFHELEHNLDSHAAWLVGWLVGCFFFNKQTKQNRASNNKEIE